MSEDQPFNPDMIESEFNIGNVNPDANLSGIKVRAFEYGPGGGAPRNPNFVPPDIPETPFVTDDERTRILGLNFEGIVRESKRFRVYKLQVEQSGNPISQQEKDTQEQYADLIEGRKGQLYAAAESMGLFKLIDEREADLWDEFNLIKLGDPSLEEGGMEKFKAVISKWNLSKTADNNTPDELKGAKAYRLETAKKRLQDQIRALENKQNPSDVFVDSKIEKLHSDEQLRVVRSLLNTLELSDSAISQQTQNIREQIAYLRTVIAEEAAYPGDPDHLPRLDVAVIREARARIRLHEFNVAIRRIDLDADNPKQDIRTQLQSLQVPTDIPDGEDFAVLIKGRIDSLNGGPGPYAGKVFMKDINVGDMMLQIQQAAIVGADVDGHGQVVKWTSKEKLVSAKLRDKIKTSVPHVEGDYSEVAYRLGTRAAKALGVIAIWDLPKVNVADGTTQKAPDSPLGKGTYMQQTREATYAKRRSDSGTATDDAGPVLTIDLLPVPGIFTSALHSATYSENGEDVHIMNQFLWDDIKAAKEAGAKPSILKAKTLEAIRLDPYNAPTGAIVDFKNLPYEKLPGDFLETFWTKSLPTQLEVRAMLLKSKWTPDELTNPDEIEKRKAKMNTVDPLGTLQLRQGFLYGLISEAARNFKGIDTKNSIFEYATWDAFMHLHTDGTAPFVSKEQWDKIMVLCQNAELSPGGKPAVVIKLAIKELLGRSILTSK